MMLGCIIVTLVIGLEIWYSTLQTRANLAVMWDAEGPQMQQLLQARVRHRTIPYFAINVLILSSVAMLRVYENTISYGLDLPKPSCCVSEARLRGPIQ